MTESLTQLHDMAANLLAALEPAQRSRLLRRMAADMRRVNQQRMARQQAPDGSRWTPRKTPAPQKAATRPVQFLYPASGSGPPRLVDMRSWIGRGDTLIGFDREADGVRSFRRDRVIRWLPGEGSADPSSLPPKLTARGRRGRSQPMFRALRSNRFLKTGAGPDQAWVEFTGRAGRIARIHHYGLRDRVAQAGPEIEYPARELLGFSPGAEGRILNAFIDHASQALGWSARS